MVPAEVPREAGTVGAVRCRGLDLATSGEETGRMDFERCVLGWGEITGNNYFH